jgi:hypothetical protein
MTSRAHDLLKGGEQRGIDLLAGGEQRGPGLLSLGRRRCVQGAHASALSADPRRESDSERLAA